MAGRIERWMRWTVAWMYRWTGAPETLFSPSLGCPSREDYFRSQSHSIHWFFLLHSNSYQHCWQRGHTFPHLFGKVVVCKVAAEWFQQALVKMGSDALTSFLPNSTTCQDYLRVTWETNPQQQLPLGWAILSQILHCEWQ